MSLNASSVSPFNSTAPILKNNQISVKKKSNIGLYSPIMWTSVAVGALHGISKEYDIEPNFNAVNTEYRTKLKILKDGGQLEEYQELLHAPKQVAMKMRGLKKILDPADRWVLKQIGKLPKGYKLSSFLTKSNGHHKLLFGKLHYDTPLILKGAGFMAVVGLSVSGIIAGINKLSRRREPGKSVTS